MANIRINALPPTTSVLADDVLPMDGASTRKIKPIDLLSSVRPIATQAQAEAGTDNTTSMTPLTGAQQIAAKLPNTAAGRAMLAAADAAAQRTLLALGGSALLSVGTTAGTVAAGDDIRFAGVAGIVDQATAEAGTNNTGIMSPLRTKQQIDARVGTAAGTLAAGNDSRIVGAVQRTGDTMTGPLTVNAALQLGFFSTSAQIRNPLDNSAGRVMDIGEFPNLTTAGADVRVFRGTNTSGSKTFTIYRGDNTSTIDHRLTAGTSGTLADFCRNGGNLLINGQTAWHNGNTNGAVTAAKLSSDATYGQATAQVANRTALAALAATAKAAVINNEGGRNGLFAWNSANLSAMVTLDTAQGIYVAPASAPTGASGAWVRVFDGDIFARWFGAVGDGTTDDAPEIQVSLNVAAGTADRRRVVLDGRHFVNANITVPANIALEGTKGLIGGIDPSFYLTSSPSIILSSAATITLSNASHVRNLLIFRSGLTIPCTSAQVAAWAGRAITLVNGTSDMVLEGLMILGFEYAVYTDPASANTSRIRINRVSIDCKNGIYSKNALDVCYFEEIHCWPYCTATAPDETNHAQNRRDGSALYLEGSHDWAEVNNFFSYGYARGIRLNGANNTVIIGGAADNPPPSSGYLDGAIGVLIEGDTNEVTVIGHRVAAKQYGFAINSTDDGRNDIQLIGCRALACVTAGFWMVAGRVHVLGGSASGIVVNTGVGVKVETTIEECRLDNMSFVDLAGGISNGSTSTRTLHRDCNFSSVTTKVSNPYVMSQAAADPMTLDGESLAVSVTAGAGSFGTLNSPADYAGKMVTLKFNSALTVISGGNMKLDGGANFVTTANDTLTLLSDGTNWLEVSRSVNP